jgi:hypothetical protein
LPDRVIPPLSRAMRWGRLALIRHGRVAGDPAAPSAGARSLAAAGSIASRCAELGRWRLVEILEGQHCDPDPPDPVLRALARLARHDPDAVGLLFTVMSPVIARLAPAYAGTLGYDKPTATRFEPPTTRVAYGLRWLAGPHVHRAAIARRREQARICPLNTTRRGQSRDHPDSADRAARVDLTAATCLRPAGDAGVIAEADTRLVHATRIAGHTLGWAARRLGIGHTAAKKHGQRAEVRWAAWRTPPTSTPIAGVAADRGAVA